MKAGQGTCIHEGDPKQSYTQDGGWTFDPKELELREGFLVGMATTGGCPQPHQRGQHPRSNLGQAGRACQVQEASDGYDGEKRIIIERTRKLCVSTHPVHRIGTRPSGPVVAICMSLESERSS